MRPHVRIALAPNQMDPRANEPVWAEGGFHVPPGHHLGPYEIIEPIGAGGMGQVYRAHDERLHRDVAVKILPPALLADPTRRARFVQEARAASALEHPHIAVIHDIGEADGVTYIAMELVDGPTILQYTKHKTSE
jgi:serine/threonine protein kinase